MPRFAPPQSPLLMPRRRLSVLSLLLGLLFLAASMTPSLIPRGAAVQGVLGGLVMALGYLIAQIALTLWRLAEMPRLHGRAARIAHWLVALPVLAVLAMSLGDALRWQNDLRARMGMEAQEGADLLAMLLIVALVFSVLSALGFAVQALFDVMRRRLYRVMPQRRANVIGFVLVGLGLFVATRDGIVDSVFDLADQSYEAAQNLFDDAPPPPALARMAGGPGSLVDWGAMGQPGRDWVAHGPDAGDIAAFTGRPALDPIRVYVGRAQHDTPQERATLALTELQRLGAFERKVLVIASPTGTGWLDPGSHDPLEYMHDGDIATVAVQYSYLQSPLALIFETRSGLDQAEATIRAVHGHWKTLPPETRPRLYIHGLSLGAWSSMYGTDLLLLVDQPISGALWAGPPFPSGFWNMAQRMRAPDSPWVQPRVGQGEVIRFASHQGSADAGAAWGAMRIMFLQYASDPIVFYEPQSVWRPPQWMREPAAPDVTPYLRFMPVVTHFQLVADMMLATAVPGGYGHSYYARDYIGPWVEVTQPEGWDAADTARLIAHCDLGFQKGCRNGEWRP